MDYNKEQMYTIPLEFLEKELKTTTIRKETVLIKNNEFLIKYVSYIYDELRFLQTHSLEPCERYELITFIIAKFISLIDIDEATLEEIEVNAYLEFLLEIADFKRKEYLEDNVLILTVVGIEKLIHETRKEQLCETEE